MKKKGSLLRTVLVMLILGAGIVFLYYQASNQNAEDKVESSYISTNLENLLARDLEAAYPPTAREVIKLYARILIVLYGAEGDVAEDQIGALIDQIRMLYSEKLLEQNDRTAQIEGAGLEIMAYREAESGLYAYVVEKADSAVTWSEGGREYFRLIASFSRRTKGIQGRIYEQFILIKEGSQWKIHGWETVDGEEMDTY